MQQSFLFELSVANGVLKTTVCGEFGQLKLISVNSTNPNDDMETHSSCLLHAFLARSSRSDLCQLRDDFPWKTPVGIAESQRETGTSGFCSGRPRSKTRSITELKAKGPARRSLRVFGERCVRRRRCAGSFLRCN